MAVLFMDSFDSYGGTWADATKRGWNTDFTNWFVLSTSYGRNGGYGIGLNTTGGSPDGWLVMPANAVGTFWAAWWGSIPASGYAWIAFGDSGTTHVFLTFNGTNIVAKNGAGTVLGTGTTNMVGVPTAHFQVKIVLGTAGTGSFRLLVNNVQDINVSGVTTQNSANNYVNELRFGSSAPGGQAFAGTYFDDMILGDGSGTVNNDVPGGDVRIECHMPSAAGTTTGWTATGAASNWQATNEIPENGDTSYVSTGTVNAIDTYAITDLTSVASAKVIAVQASLVARSDGTNSIAPVIRSGATNYVGNAVNVGSAYISGTTVWNTDPATSAAWTLSGFNAIEAGEKLTA